MIKKFIITVIMEYTILIIISIGILHLAQYVNENFVYLLFIWFPVAIISSFIILVYTTTEV